MTVSVLLGIACVATTAPKKLPRDHSALATHSDEQVIAESGLANVLKDGGLDPDSTYVIGTIAFVEDLAWPEAAIVDMIPTQFKEVKIALSVKPRRGKVILDFFEGLEGASENHVVNGAGHLIQERISARRWGDDRPIWQQFHADFPDVGETFTLTYKEFDTHCFYLKDVPPGTVYLWFHGAVDLGGATAQHPIRFSLTPLPGQIFRHDIRAHWGDLYDML